jgi:predicted  nucleic acid-binding Zn-ribbon protein
MTENEGLEDPEVAYLRSSLSALQQHSQLLDSHCAALELQNRQLDLEISQLTEHFKQERDKAVDAEKDKKLSPSPLAVLALEVHKQKQELRQLSEREEVLKHDLGDMQTRNSDAEQRIYDLDDLVWKKANEVAELQRTLAVSIPVARLQKSLCEDCQRLLVEEMNAQTVVTSLPVTRRQASLGTLLLSRDGLSL